MRLPASAVMESTLPSAATFPCMVSREFSSQWKAINIEETSAADMNPQSSTTTCSRYAVVGVGGVGVSDQRPGLALRTSARTSADGPLGNCPRARPTASAARRVD